MTWTNSQADPTTLEDFDFDNAASASKSIDEVVWSNDEADVKPLEDFDFDNAASASKSIGETVWSNDEADLKSLGLPPSEITTLDGAETFTLIPESDPVLDNSVPMSGFDGLNLRVVDYQEWHDNAKLGNQRGGIITQSDGKRGLILRGYIDSSSTYPTTQNSEAGPVTSHFPLLGDDPATWNIIRFGFLVGYDNSEADQANEGRLGFGLHANLDATFDGVHRGARFQGEMQWNSLAYNSGNSRWDTSSGLYTITCGDPNQTIIGLSPVSKNFRAFGDAGTSYFPIFIELTKNGPSPLGDGLIFNTYAGLGSSATGITASLWETYMSMDSGLLPVSGTNYVYFHSTSIAFPVDHPESYSWSDFNNFFIRSFSKGIFIERAGYKILP